MTTRHKWADVIIAFAEGKAIQFKNPSGLNPDKWEDTPSISGIEFSHLEWRVKPQPKTGWVNFYENATASFSHGTKELADKAAASSGGKRIACVQWTEGDGL